MASSAFGLHSTEPGKGYKRKIVWLVGCWGLTQYQQLWSYHGENKFGNLISL